MSKGKKRRGNSLPRGGGMDMRSMAQQIQKMQEDMLKEQEALADETLEVSAGGGAVTVEITGHQRVTKIIIKPEVIDPDDAEMLGDLIMAAVNQAIEQSQALAAQRLEGLTGGLNLPGL